MTEALAEVAELVRQETGIVLAATQRESLQAAVNRAAPGLDAAGFLRGTSRSGPSAALLWTG